MSNRSTPLPVGQPLPNSSILSTGGDASSLRDALGGAAAVVYYMRTATCPVCNGHLRQLGRQIAAGDYGDTAIHVIVPGAADEAQQVATRHAGAGFHVWSSETAHEEAGLFVRVGLQQSGTAVVDAAGVVSYSTSGTVPLGAYDAAATVAAATAATLAP